MAMWQKETLRTASHIMKWWRTDQSMMGKDTISAGEQNTSPDHLGHYAAHWPYVHWRQMFRWWGSGHAKTKTMRSNKKNKKKWKQKRYNNANWRAVMLIHMKMRACSISQMYERKSNAASSEWKRTCLQSIPGRKLRIKVCYDKSL